MFTLGHAGVTQILILENIVYALQSALDQIVRILEDQCKELSTKRGPEKAITYVNFVLKVVLELSFEQPIQREVGEATHD